MANKDLRTKPHRVITRGKVREDAGIWEDNTGLWVYSKEGLPITVTWSRIRAALKRKDK